MAEMLGTCFTSCSRWSLAWYRCAHIVEHLVLKEDYVRSGGGELGQGGLKCLLDTPPGVSLTNFHHQIPVLPSNLDAVTDYCDIVLATLYHQRHVVVEVELLDVGHHLTWQLVVGRSGL